MASGERMSKEEVQSVALLLLLHNSRSVDIKTSTVQS